MQSLAVVAFTSALLAVPAAIGSAAQDDHGFPLSASRLLLGKSDRVDKQQIHFEGRWRSASAQAIPDPIFADASLQIAGASPADGDSGVIALPGSQWKPGRNGYRYDDPSGAQGGIQSVVLKWKGKRGTLAVKGAHANWTTVFAAPQTMLTVTLRIGDARWCAEFPRGAVRSGRAKLVARRAAAPASCPCERFTSTYAAIQQVIFEKRGCTAGPCHGASTQGGLDLRADVSFGNLVDVPSPLGQMSRVHPGDKEQSFLWRKLAKGTLGLGGVPGTAMPNGLPPIPETELHALGSWIQAGAPATGVVDGTDTLLGSCLPDVTPGKVRPPAKPAADEGVQFYGPPWDVPIQGEAEVCYATYYDYSATIPAAMQVDCPAEWGPPGTRCFYYNKQVLTQDPNSHHSLVHFYRGKYALKDPAANFGPFTCHGGPNAGMPCDPEGLGVAAPAGAECGERSACAGKTVDTLACLGYGPPDFGFDITGAGSATSPSLVISTEVEQVTQYPTDVYAVLPVKGTLVWNSHAFNITKYPTTNEQWFTLSFAPINARKYPLQTVVDATANFVMDVPPFERREYCQTYTFPQHGRLFQLSSHTHKRGKEFRIWGPGIPADCSSMTGPCDPPATPSFFLTTNYADPSFAIFAPPTPFDLSDPASRRFQYCAVYDNGYTIPSEVKRRSTSPLPPPPIALGGPCGLDSVACLNGPNRGALCHGDDRVCDSNVGTADGICDACPLVSGATTEDEMFIFLGWYFVVE